MATGLCAPVRAANMYVAPAGTAAGTGTRTKPYDLVTALGGSVGQAGDTFWLGGGVYRIGHVDTEIHGRIVTESGANVVTNGSHTVSMSSAFLKVIQLIR